MLLEIKVSQFAIINQLHLQFRDGLNILSGETGAGKSVLLKSLSLLMGGKASSDTIRSGAQFATVEGSFDVSKRPDLVQRMAEMGISCEEEVLVVRRIISEDKSRVYMNGSLSTLQSLRDLVSPLIEVAGSSAPLIELTGQHENRNLLSTSYHLDLLDQYTGAWDLRQDFQRKYRIRADLLQQIQDLKSESQSKEQRLDFLKFQFNEISALNLVPGEEANLENELKRAKGTNKISTFVDSAEAALYSDDDSAYSRLSAILQKSSEILMIDESFRPSVESLTQANSLIEDAVYRLRQSMDKIESDPQKLETMQSRLSELRKLQKKFGPSVEDILAQSARMEEEIQKLENSENDLQKLEEQLNDINLDLEKMAKKLSQKRKAGSSLLADSVNHELKELNMKGVIFCVQMDPRPELGSTGRDHVEFLSQTAPKDPPRPLARFASGGELSRILLSLKRVVGSSHFPRTYLFDEVDTGVSGPTAEKVGKKLRSIAKGQQVICITHLPQVAACGDAHFFIKKTEAKGLVEMDVTELESKSRIQEIARLISGETITKTSLAHARQLLEENA